MNDDVSPIEFGLAVVEVHFTFRTAKFVLFITMTIIIFYVRYDSHFSTIIIIYFFIKLWFSYFEI